MLGTLDSEAVASSTQLLKLERIVLRTPSRHPLPAVPQVFMKIWGKYCLDYCWAVFPSGNLVDGLPLAHSTVDTMVGAATVTGHKRIFWRGKLKKIDVMTIKS